MDIVYRLGDDYPDKGSTMELMTIPQLANRVQRSRSLIHRLASDPREQWPTPTLIPGTTKAAYPVDWFDAYWEERRKVVKPGRGRHKRRLRTG